MSEVKKREPGYYWVKLKDDAGTAGDMYVFMGLMTPKVGEWFIARYMEDGQWEIGTYDIPDGYFSEINERRILSPDEEAALVSGISFRRHLPEITYVHKYILAAKACNDKDTIALLAALAGRRVMYSVGADSEDDRYDLADTLTMPDGTIHKLWVNKDPIRPVETKEDGSFEFLERHLANWVTRPYEDESDEEYKKRVLAGVSPFPVVRQAHHDRGGEVE